MDLGKTLFHGMAASALAGLMLGAALQYGGSPDRRLEGPQLHVSGPSAREPAPPAWREGDISLASYGGSIPEYVLGADWTDRAGYEPVRYEPAPASAAEAIRATTREDPVIEIAAPERPPRAYPSLGGDILADIGAPPPPLSPPAPLYARAPDGLDEMNAAIARGGEAAARRIAGRSS